MEFFEKLGKKASETYKNAAEKTNKIASDTKLKLKINDCKSKINDLYQEIGKKVYQKFVLEGNFEIKEDISEELKNISELTNEIEEYEGQRLELSDMKQCPNCKNKIEKTAKFCPECGVEQPEEPSVEDAVVDEEQKEDKAEEVSEDAEEIVVEVIEEEVDKQDSEE